MLSTTPVHLSHTHQHQQLQQQQLSSLQSTAEASSNVPTRPSSVLAIGSSTSKTLDRDIVISSPAADDLPVTLCHRSLETGSVQQADDTKASEVQNARVQSASQVVVQVETNANRTLDDVRRRRRRRRRTKYRKKNCSLTAGERHQQHHHHQQQQQQGCSSQEL